MTNLRKWMMEELQRRARHCHRLTSSLLIENASGQQQGQPDYVARTRPEAFPIKANDYPTKRFDVEI